MQIVPAILPSMPKTIRLMEKSIYIENSGPSSPEGQSLINNGFICGKWSEVVTFCPGKFSKAQQICCKCVEYFESIFLPFWSSLRIFQSRFYEEYLRASWLSNILGFILYVF